MSPLLRRRRRPPRLRRLRVFFCASSVCSPCACFCFCSDRCCVLFDFCSASFGCCFRLCCLAGVFFLSPVGGLPVFLPVFLRWLPRLSLRERESLRRRDCCCERRPRLPCVFLPRRCCDCFFFLPSSLVNQPMIVAQNPLPAGFLRFGAGVDGFKVPTAAASTPLRSRIACGDSGST